MEESNVEVPRLCIYGSWNRFLVSAVLACSHLFHLLVAAVYQDVECRHKSDIRKSLLFLAY